MKVPGLPSGPVKALTSAWGNAGVLMANGVYYDWGYNQAGQVGDGTQRMATRPVQVKQLPAVSQVSEGGSLGDNGQTIALARDGRVYVWGNGQQGQLGNGSTGSASKPELLKEPAGAHFTKVNSGGATDYAVTSSGDLYAWGYNRHDQVGDGVGGRKQPVYTRPVNDRLTVAQVSSTASDVAAFTQRIGEGGQPRECQVARSSRSVSALRPVHRSGCPRCWSQARVSATVWAKGRR